MLSEFKPYLHDRVRQDPDLGNEQLLREICERGYRGGLGTLRAYLAQVRRDRSAPPAPRPTPSARQITAWIMRPDDKLDEDDRLGLKAAVTACPHLAAVTELAHAFKDGLTLPWNSGKVEGAVTRIKMIKRQMYGRAKLDLLRKRILTTPKTTGSGDDHQT